MYRQSLRRQMEPPQESSGCARPDVAGADCTRSRQAVKNRAEVLKTIFGEMSKESISVPSSPLALAENGFAFLGGLRLRFLIASARAQSRTRYVTAKLATLAEVIHGPCRCMLIAGVLLLAYCFALAGSTMESQRTRVYRLRVVTG
jgi:hypothetical protein